jgi:hypothetical protein
MPRVLFEPTTSVFERAKKIHPLDRVANVIGDHRVLLFIKHNKDTLHFKLLAWLILIFQMYLPYLPITLHK